MRDDRERLRDILEAIERIEKHTSAGRSVLDKEELVQTWVVYHLMILGEACRALSPTFRAKHPEDVWAQASGLRNIIVHHYFGIDLEIVWGVVERDLPAFRKLIQEILLSEP